MKRNTYLAITIAVGLLAAPAVAFAETEAAFSHAGSVSADSKRLFVEQGLVYYEGFTGVLDHTITHEESGVYGNVWHAETGNRRFNETDLCLGRRGALGSETDYDASYCAFLIDGPNAHRLRFVVSHQISESISADLTGDIVRGGFETNTVRARLRASDELTDSVTGSASLGVSYDTWSEDTVGHVKLGITFPIFNLSATAAYDRFEVLSQGPLNRSRDQNGDRISLSTGWAF